MPFIMPDGRRLSSLLDRGEQTGRSSVKRKGKPAYRHRMEALFEQPTDENEAADMAAVSHLGARSKLRCVDRTQMF
jgi:hypothetical protein